MAKTLQEKLDTDGYVVLEEFLSLEECDELLKAAMDFTEHLPEKEERPIFTTTKQSHLKDNYFFESNDKIRPFFEEQALDESGELKVEPRYSLNKVGHALHLLHPLFRCYTYCQRVKTIVKALRYVKPAVVQSMVIYKNPGVGGEVVAHQDATFLFTEPIPPLGFWIALEDATIENGCLWIAGGSHKSGVHRRLIRNPETDSADKLIFDRPPAVYPNSSFTAVPVKKGTCIILHGNVVHKSAANKSEQSRPAYTFHVVELDNNTYSPDNWLQEGDGAPFLDIYNTLQLM